MPGAQAQEIKTLDAGLLAGIAAGKWVAISQDQERVVAVGNTADEAIRQAAQNGEMNPYILRVPFEHSALVL